MVSESQAIASFDLGYRCGQLDERKTSRRRDELIARLVTALDKAEHGDSSALDELRAQAEAEDLVDDLERFLRDQDGGSGPA